jgi:hypothetical protein
MVKMKKMIRLACAGVAMAFLSPGVQAQTYTGVQGPGWREISMPLASSTVTTAQAVGTYSTRNAVLIEIDNATGLAYAPIPSSAKDNILSDGFGSGPIYVDRDVVNAIADGTASTKFGEYIQPDSATAYNSAEGRESVSSRATTRTQVTPQGLFCNSGWRTYTLSRNIPFNTVNASKAVLGGSLTFDGRMNGSADVRIVVEYKKSDWSLCIPYTVRFKEAGAVGTINLNDSRLALTASVSTTVAEDSSRQDLYKSNGVVWLGPIPVWYTYAIPMDYGYKVILSASTTVEYSSQLSGQITFNYTCANGNCSGSSDTSTVMLTNPNPNWAVQADATFDPFVKVGLEGRVYPVGNWYLASAGIGFKFSTPLQVYGYYGNACGDADKDGNNETVNTYFADLQARVSLVSSWSFLGGEKVNYVSFGGWAGRKINGSLHKVLNTEGNHTPLWNRRLYYTDTGSPSIFSPVLRQQASTFNGAQYEHVLRTSMRPCVPFENTYLVDIVDPAGQVTTVSVPSRTTTTTTKIYNNSSVWRLRASGSRDDDGRVFNNSSSVAPILDPAAPPSGGTPPTITGFLCPDRANSGGGTYWCGVTYSSATPATVRWPNGSSGLEYSGRCTSGSRPTVTVTVTNAAGPVSSSKSFSCPTGPIP